MSPLVMRLAVTCVRSWTWLYTWRMPRPLREIRRAEIESDLWETQHDAAGDHRLGSAFHILVRLLIGIPDDLGWRLEQEAAAGPLTQASVALSARVTGAALIVCALWMIDADAGRRRQTTADAGPAALLDHEIQEIMTMRSGIVPHSAGRRLPRLTAGIVATVGVSMFPQLAAQSPPVAAGGPAFEAASVKPNKSGDGRVMLIPQPGGRLTATNVPVALLIRFAYDLPDSQVSGGPNWLDSDRFDVVAKAEGDPTLEQVRVMLRRLLAERFKLTAHTETRQLPIYALVMARSDGRTGPHLRRSDADCAPAAPSVDPGVGFPLNNNPPRCGFFGFAPGTDLPSARGGLAFRGLTMAALAKTLMPMVRRSVADRTGLTGSFDAEFDFIAELPIPPPPPGAPNPFGNDPFGSIFTVFPEQLGLKLESTRGPVDVLVIDRAEQPTPD